MVPIDIMENGIGLGNKATRNETLHDQLDGHGQQALCTHNYRLCGVEKHKNVASLKSKHRYFDVTSAHSTLHIGALKGL